MFVLRSLGYPGALGSFDLSAALLAAGIVRPPSSAVVLWRSSTAASPCVSAWSDALWVGRNSDILSSLIVGITITPTFRHLPA